MRAWRFPLGLGMLLVILIGTPSAAREPDVVPKAGWIELASADVIYGERRVDIDGDGIRDVVLIGKNRLDAWRGVRGQLPEAKPTWNPAWPEWPNAEMRPSGFLDFAAGPNKTHTLVWATRDRMQAVGWKHADKKGALLFAKDITWDAGGGNNLAFAPLTDALGGWIEPMRSAYVYRWPGDEIVCTCSLAPARKTLLAGQFLGEPSKVSMRYPAPFFGKAPLNAGGEGSAGFARPTCLWVVSDGTVVAQEKDRRTEFDARTLLRSGPLMENDIELVDLDQDGRPEVFHRYVTNRTGDYRIFALPVVPALRGGTSNDSGPQTIQAPSIPAPATKFSLTGFQLPPIFADFNGDGALDLGLTTISIDGRNALRALTTGVVSAETRAYLNQRGTRFGSSNEPKSFFKAEPSAIIKSDIHVEIQFTYAGAIHVKRSFTIVVDGDYNGDGLGDFAVRQAGDKMAFKLSTQEGLWTTDAKAISIPPVGNAADVEGYPVDVTGDGHDEILLIYRAPPGGRDRCFVLRTGI